MTEAKWVEENEFERVAAEATARMTLADWSFKRPICVYENNYCNNCGKCEEEDLEAEAEHNYWKEAF